MTTTINLNGISEIDFTNGIASVSNLKDVTTITLAPLGVTGTGLTAGQLIIGAGSSVITVGNLSGDATTSGATTVAVIKLRGASLDATIGSAGAGQDGQVIYWDNSSSSYKLKTVTSGVTSVSGDGSVYTNSASTGAVTLALGTQTANRVFAGPTSGGAATPGFRALVAADLPIIGALGTPVAGAGTAYSNSGSSATATANVTITVGDFVLVVSGNVGGPSTVAISDNGTALVLTSVAPSVNGTAVYTGTITGGAANAMVGKVVTVAGFANVTQTTGLNNGSFMCVASTATTLTLLNPYATAEVHAATAANTYYKITSVDVANFTNADCIWVCYSALVSATSVTTAGASNDSIAVATFTGVSGIGAFTTTGITTTPGTNTLTTTKANSMVATGFLYVSSAGTITASASSGTLRTNSDSGSNSFLGTAIVTTQATTVGAYTNAIALSRTATTGACWSLELLQAGSQFDSNAIQFQNAYWDGSVAVTDTWTMKAVLTPSQAYMPAIWQPTLQQVIVSGNGRTVNAVPLINRLELDFSGEGGPLLSTPSQNILGSIFLQKISPPAPPTVTPTGGTATTYQYRVLPFDANNMPAVWSLSGSTSAGAATLVPGTAFNTVTWNSCPGAAYYQLVRQTATSTKALPIAYVPATSAATVSYVDDGSVINTSAVNPNLVSANWTGGINFSGVWLTSIPATNLTGGGLAILSGTTAFAPSIAGYLAVNGNSPNTGNWTQAWTLGFGATSDANDRIALQANLSNYSVGLTSSRTTLAADPGIFLGGGQWTLTSGVATEVGIGALGAEQTSLAKFVPTNGSATYVALRIAPTINQALVGPFNITNCNFTSSTSLTLTVSSGTGLVNGNTIIIAGCTGTNNAQANGTWTLSNGGGTTTLTITGSGWVTGNHAEATGTIKQQATGAWTMLLGNPQITAEGSLDSANRLIDLQNNNTSKFAVDGTGMIVVPSTNTATSANAGANGAVPAQVVGYLIINVNGTNVKVPYFAT